MSAKISTIKRQCVMYKIQVFMSKIKVTHQGQTENPFTMINFQIIISLGTCVHHSKIMCHNSDLGLYAFQGHRQRSFLSKSSTSFVWFLCPLAYMSTIAGYVYPTWPRCVCPWLRSQTKVKCRICFWCITSTYFVVFSYYLAQVSTIAKCMSLMWTRSLCPRSRSQ